MDERRKATVSKTGESVNYGYHPIIDFFRFDINIMTIVMMVGMTIFMIVIMRIISMMKIFIMLMIRK